MAGKYYYMITTEGLLDVLGTVADESRDAVLEELEQLTNDFYGSMSAQPISIAAVDDKTLSGLTPEAIAGFGRFFQRNGIKRGFMVEWIEDNQPEHHLLRDGRMVFFEDALGLIPRECVDEVRDDLSRICAGEDANTGTGRILYVNTMTVSTMEGQATATKDALTTVMADKGHQMMGVIEWTGEPLSSWLTTD